MIRGVVTARNEATVRLRVRGPSGADLTVAAIVDSGFTASVALPIATITALGLVRQSGGRAVLADGTVRQFDVYTAEVSWDGAWRPAVVSGVGREALIGMRLLAGYQLRVEVIPGGVVEITPVP